MSPFQKHLNRHIATEMGLVAYKALGKGGVGGKIQSIQGHLEDPTDKTVVVTSPCRPIQDSYISLKRETP